MKTLNNKKGFTLLEMLVVVLIIGILAGVALPSYRKALIKSKLAQVDAMMDAAKKNVQAYIDMNGAPDKDSVNVLHGPNSPFPLACNKTDGDFCFGSEIQIAALCAPEYCSIRWGTLDGGSLSASAEYTLDYSGEGQWVLDGANIPADGAANQIYCDWFDERGFEPKDCK